MVLVDFIVISLLSTNLKSGIICCKNDGENSNNGNKSNKNCSSSSNNNRNKETTQNPHRNERKVSNLVFYAQSTSTVVSGERKRKREKEREKKREILSGYYESKNKVAFSVCFFVFCFFLSWLGLLLVYLFVPATKLSRLLSSGEGGE